MKHLNAVRALRSHELAQSTRVFKARGALLKRCPDCLLAAQFCICDTVTPYQSELGVCMLMYHGEYYKPSNTGQLICEVVNDNFAFRWHRTEPDPKLLALLNDPSWYPIIVFPHDNVDCHRQISKLPEQTEMAGKRPLFIFIDGTWREAKKIMVKSPYLDNLPVIQITDRSKGGYGLRKAYHDHHLSTVEVAVALFEQVGQIEMADSLNQLFLTFKARYQEIKKR